LARILGIGGVFFRSADPERRRSWYSDRLGIQSSPDGAAVFPWRSAEDSERREMTVWCTFPAETDDFGPTRPAFMISDIVDDRDGILAALREAGATVEEKVEEYEYGRFGWATDPEGNRLELWQPAP
jgi:predicted enzyme related to lactoylglutathione lyase